MGAPAALRNYLTNRDTRFSIKLRIGLECIEYTLSLFSSIGNIYPLVNAVSFAACVIHQKGLVNF